MIEAPGRTIYVNKNDTVLVGGPRLIKKPKELDSAASTLAPEQGPLSCFLFVSHVSCQPNECTVSVAANRAGRVRREATLQVVRQLAKLRDGALVGCNGAFDGRRVKGSIEGKYSGSGAKVKK